MQYMLLIYNQPEDVDRTQEWWDAVTPKYAAYAEMLQEKGAYVAAAPLTEPSSATTIRLQDGKQAIIDGPFAETKEWLAGYFIVNAATLDEAIAYARECPAFTHRATVEVRPVIDRS